VKNFMKRQTISERSGEASGTVDEIQQQLGATALGAKSQ
jgi:hypothetical protein